MMSPLADRGDAFNVIHQTVLERRAMLLLMRGGRYSVIKGYSPSSFSLFDSGGSWWMMKNVTGVCGDSGDARHVFYPATFLAMSA
ncbi:hypothetical protein [Sphingomonas daechungensis]|nr:hypothetical protein [Sphingomonas daechungensis]